MEPEEIVEPATLHTTTRTAATAPDEPIVSWRAIPEAMTAHAYRSSGPGWMTSLCGAERFTFRCELTPRLSHCQACELALYGTEAERRMLWGDR